VDQAAVETWLPEEPFEAVAERLHDELVRKGILGKAELPPWEASITRAIAALEIAIAASRVRSSERNPRGRIAEIVGNDWAITDIGIESLTHDFRVLRAEFPSMYSPYNDPNSGGFYRGPLVPPEIAQPDWVDADEWRYLINRASKRFTRVKAFGRWDPSRVLIPSSLQDSEH
jgi:hypothetical protein